MDLASNLAHETWEDSIHPDSHRASRRHRAASDGLVGNGGLADSVVRIAFE